MRGDAITEVFVLIYGLGGFVVLILWLAYIISSTSSLRKIRQEAEKHTALLQEIARNTRPPQAPGTTAKPSAVDYGLREKKSGAGTVLAVLGVLFVVLLVVALARQ